MADPDRSEDPHRPPHPNNPPRTAGPTSNVARWVGIGIVVVLLIAALAWLFGGFTTPEHTLGEPAGVGTALDPTAEDPALAEDPTPAEPAPADPPPN